MHIPGKPEATGICSYILADCAGYLYDFFISADETRDDSDATGYKPLLTVLKLLRFVLPDKLHHCIVADSYFGSEKLASVLQMHGLGFVIGCRADRPRYLFADWLDGCKKDTNPDRPAYFLHEFRWLMREPGILAFEWRDRNYVRLLSNLVTGNQSFTSTVHYRPWRLNNEFANGLPPPEPPIDPLPAAALDEVGATALKDYEEKHASRAAQQQAFRKLDALLEKTARDLPAAAPPSAAPPAAAPPAAAPPAAAAAAPAPPAEVHDADVSSEADDSGDEQQMDTDAILRVLPAVIQIYRWFYHGVDAIDAHVAACRVVHRNMKWTTHVFWTVLIWCVANARCLYNAWEKPRTPMPMVTFLISIILEMFNNAEKIAAAEVLKHSKGLHPWIVAGLQSEVRQASHLDDNILHGMMPDPALTHLLCHSDKKQVCEVCRHRPSSDPRRTSKTTTYCANCGVFLHSRANTLGTPTCWDTFHAH